MKDKLKYICNLLKQNVVHQLLIKQKKKLNKKQVSTNYLDKD